MIIFNYLMIIFNYLIIIWWLFGDYLVIIWWLFDPWLFDDYLMLIWWLFAVSFRLIAVLIPQQRPSRYHAGPAYIVGYKLSATWSQAAMERQILSHQQDLASALAAAQALLRRDDPLDPGPWTPTSD